MKQRILKTLRRPLIVSGLASILLTFAGVSLWAAPATPVPSQDLTNPGIDTSPREAEALLPGIPLQREETLHLDGLLVDEMVAKVPPGTLQHDPDEYKSLYGFYGPFYNTANLDGRVVVLDKTVSRRPTYTLKAYGLVRNQTRHSVYIHSITATLRGPQGEVLDIVTASIPVQNLRPGEPGPLVIESAVAQNTIVNIEWSVDSEPSLGKPRPFAFDIIDDRDSRQGSHYDLFVAIRNEDAAASRPKILAAWLDEQGKLIYVDALLVRATDDPKTWRSWTDLGPNESGYLTYNTLDSWLVSRLIKARVMLWGIVD
jgi:hypothetical protein